MIFEIKRQYFLFVSSRQSIAQPSGFLCPGILFLLLNTLVPLQKNRMITTGCSSVCSNFLYPIKQLPNISVSTNEALSNKNVASANRSGNMQEPKSTTTGPSICGYVSFNISDISFGRHHLRYKRMILSYLG